MGVGDPMVSQVILNRGEEDGTKIAFTEQKDDLSLRGSRPILSTEYI